MTTQTEPQTETGLSETTLTDGGGCGGGACACEEAGKEKGDCGDGCDCR